MKRSTNLAHTRKPRNPLLDMALFLRDIGMTDDQIKASLLASQPDAEQPDQNAQETPERNQ